MIKAIILDIDGIIIGEKIGFNSPNPHPDVLHALHSIHQKGLPIILCSAKPHFAISKIINDAQLTNPHITDGGAVIIDPIDNMIVEKHIVPKNLAREIVAKCLQNNIYVECYTTKEYTIQESQKSDITKKHQHILQTQAKIVPSLLAEISTNDVTKIMPIALNLDDKNRVDMLLNAYREKLSISWGVHPVALPLQFGIVTPLGSSKKEAAISVAKNLSIQMEDILGIGDSTSDWSYIQLCGYAATLKNGSNKIRELIASKGEGKYFIGKSVDENGILDIFDYFSLE